MASDYTTGTVSIANGSRALTGVGTGWKLAAFQEGDTLFLKGFAIPLESIESNTAATLSEDWPGADVENAAYRLRYESDAARMSAKVQDLIDGLADAKGEQGDPGENFDPDAEGLFAERDGYDDEAVGFSFLSLDGDEGETTTAASIFIRRGEAGEWFGPIPFQGPPGDDAAIDVEDVLNTPVVAGAAKLAFGSVFTIEADPESPTRARINLSNSGFIAFADAALGGNYWRLPLNNQIEIVPGEPWEWEPGEPMEF